MEDTLHAQEPEPFCLRDGRVILVRRIRPEDGEQLQALHRRLSEHTRRMRFFTPLRRLDPKFALHLCAVDFVKRAAFVATFPGDDQLHAVGRYEETEPGTAEVAFVVEDRLHGMGLGRELLHHVAHHARKHGIAEFTALVLAENTDMISLFRRSGYAFEMAAHGETETIRLQIGAPAARGAKAG